MLIEIHEKQFKIEKYGIAKFVKKQNYKKR